jgi:hypothetical protein
MIGKLVIHACGGCGISIVEKIKDNLDKLGNGFSTLEFNFLDTTESSIKDSIFGMDSFYKITSSKFDDKGIDGSGGERRTNAVEIDKGVQTYLDDKNLHSLSTGEYHVVISSCSGGSGSVISPLLTKGLIARSIPVIPILVADASGKLAAINTLNTISSYHAIAEEADKALSIVYANNTINGVTSKETMEKTDRFIFENILTFSLFMSGQNKAMDHQDIIGLVDQSSHKTIGYTPGLYNIGIGSQTVQEHIKDRITTLRSLTKEDEDHKVDFQTDYHKSGQIVEKEVIDMLGEKAPVYLFNYTGRMEQVTEELEELVDSIYDEIEARKAQKIKSNRRSKRQSNGLVF